MCASERLGALQKSGVRVRRRLGCGVEWGEGAGGGWGGRERDRGTRKRAHDKSDTEGLYKIHVFISDGMGVRL